MGQGLLDPIFAGENGLGNVLVNMFGGSGNAMALIEYDVNRTYDKTTLTETGTDTQSYTCDMSPPAPLTVKEVPGASIEAGDLFTVIPSFQTPEQPPQKAKLTYKGDEYTIVMTWVITSGEEVCNYRLQLRSV